MKRRTTFQRFNPEVARLRRFAFKGFAVVIPLLLLAWVIAIAGGHS